MDDIFGFETELAQRLGLAAHGIPDLLGGEAGLIHIPEASDVEHTPEELASLVARASNVCVRMSHFSGVAHANLKLAKGRYERKFKQERAQTDAGNDAKREGYAMERCAVEHARYITAEAIAELVEGYLLAARVASESARKILDKAHVARVASQREEHGVLRESDYTPY